MPNMPMIIYTRYNCKTGGIMIIIIKGMPYPNKENIFLPGITSAVLLPQIWSVQIYQYDIHTQCHTAIKRITLP